MKLVSSIFVVLSVISVCWAQCEPPASQTKPTVTNFQYAINRISSCDFPSEKFNASCVSVSCPKLLAPGLCPYTSTKSLNLTALTTILTILNSCFQDQSTICSAPLTTIPIPPFSVGLSQVFVDLPIGGQCSLTPNTGTFDNVQNVSFAISPDQSSSPGPLNVVIDAPVIRMPGGLQCVISFGSFNFNLPDVNFTWSVAISPTASLDFSSDQPDVQVRNDNVTVSLGVDNFAPIDSPIQLPAFLQSAFNEGVTALYEGSGNPTAIATFYATFIASGIEATKGNCGPSS